jgi:hypothetical protein
MTLHQLHIFYVIANPMRPSNTIDNLFDALGSIDPLEVKHMIGLPLSFVGATYDLDLPTEEEVTQSMLRAFGKNDIMLL